jgi:hypothetical protein
VPIQEVIYVPTAISRHRPVLCSQAPIAIFFPDCLHPCAWALLQESVSEWYISPSPMLNYLRLSIGVRIYVCAISPMRARTAA